MDRKYAQYRSEIKYYVRYILRSPQNIFLACATCDETIIFVQPPSTFSRGGFKFCAGPHTFTLALAYAVVPSLLCCLALAILICQEGPSWSIRSVCPHLPE